MATSELVTTEDIDHLSTAIQLKPHQKDIEFTSVAKTEDGDLVSLDELYEKTGQEAIEKIIAGAESLIKRNKLTREQGLLLKVAGAETWLELPDKMNVVKGGEGFISNFIDSFITIIKNIIKYIKGVCVWIYRRIMSFLGFSKTKEEKMFLYRREREAKKAIVELYKLLNIDVDYAKLLKDFTSARADKKYINKTGYDVPKEFTLSIKNQNASAKGIIDSIPNVINLIQEFKTVSEKARSNIKIADSRYKKIMLDIRTAIQRGDIRVLNINDIKYLLANIAANYLNPTAYLDLAITTYSSINNINPNVGVGIADKLLFLQQKLKANINTITVSYDEAVYNDIAKAAEEYMRVERPTNDVVVGKEAIKILNTIVDDKDADFISKVSTMAGDNKLMAAYTSFANNIKTYTSAINASYEMLQEAELVLQKTMDAHNKINMALTAILTKDFEKLLDPSLELDEEKIKKLIGGDEPLFTFKNITTQFIEKYPDAKVPKIISTGVQAYMKSSAGKGIAKAARNYVIGFQRNR